MAVTVRLSFHHENGYRLWEHSSLMKVAIACARAVILQYLQARSFRETREDKDDDEATKEKKEKLRTTYDNATAVLSQFAEQIAAQLVFTPFCWEENQIWEVVSAANTLQTLTTIALQEAKKKAGTQNSTSPLACRSPLPTALYFTNCLFVGGRAATMDSCAARRTSNDIANRSPQELRAFLPRSTPAGVLGHQQGPIHPITLTYRQSSKMSAPSVGP